MTDTGKTLSKSYRPIFVQTEADFIQLKTGKKKRITFEVQLRDLTENLKKFLKLSEKRYRSTKH